MKYLIIYSNGHRELRMTINPTFIHMLAMGVINYIFDFKALQEYSLQDKRFEKVLQVHE